MKRVTGIGGVFLRAKDPKALAAWYETHLGIQFGGHTYSVFPAHEKDQTAFSIFAEDTEYFAPSEKQFMINLRVENFHQLLEALRAEGVHVFDEVQDGEYGKFGWILDIEGNKIELWEPADE